MLGTEAPRWRGVEWGRWTQHQSLVRKAGSILCFTAPRSRCWEQVACQFNSTHIYWVSTLCQALGTQLRTKQRPLLTWNRSVTYTTCWKEKRLWYKNTVGQKGWGVRRCPFKWEGGGRSMCKGPVVGVSLNVEGAARMLAEASSPLISWRLVAYNFFLTRGKNYLWLASSLETITSLFPIWNQKLLEFSVSPNSITDELITSVTATYFSSLVHGTIHD